MRALKEKYQMLLEDINTSHIRNIHDTIAWNERLIAIVGARNNTQYGELIAKNLGYYLAKNNIKTIR